MSRKPAQLQPESFRKILKLEESKAFNDTAVVGGLDRFLERWASDIGSMAGDQDVSGLSVGSYRRMTSQEREEWVGRWLARLESLVMAGPTPDGGSREPESATGQETAIHTPAPKTSTSTYETGDAGSISSASPATGPADRFGGPSPARLPVPPGLTLESPVDRLRGVDVKFSARLNRLGVSTIRDLLFLFPARHNDFSKVSKIFELVPGEEQTIVATVWEASETTFGRSKLKATEAVVSDETGNMRVVWFGQPYIARVLKPNSRIAISGRVDVYKDQRQFQSPEFEILDRQESLIHTGRLVPVYPLTEGLTPRRLRSIVWQALERWAPRLEEFLPDDTRERLGLMHLAEAIMQAHYPDDPPSQEMARKRLAFDELFLLQLAVLMRRKNRQEAVEGVTVRGAPEVLDSFLASLPFKLTAAQERCLGEALTDMERGTPPMNRLLQGEVGSGKTVVALAALLVAVASGYQGSIMVPTEVLAEQHFATVSQLLGGVARPRP